MVDASKPILVNRFQRVLLYFGVPVILLSAVLAVRIVWEETALTMQQGPQMIGFSLAHGGGAILFLAPPLLVIWLAVGVLTAGTWLWRKRTLSKWFWTSLTAAILVLGTLSIPPVFYQWLLIRNFAKSPHAADLLVSAAAEGDLRTVRGYLEEGVPVEATNYAGSTAAFAAAAGGSVAVIQVLSLKGANLNAISSYGDSPLEAATGNHHDETVAFLKAHGAIQIHGTPEQREAASQAIVKKAIERQKIWH
jgi:hypothetical protein